MRHFSCDLCGKDMTANTDPRYILRMEVFPAHNPDELSAEDLDQDQVDAMAEMLEELEQGTESPSAVPACRKLEYDLCPGCHRKFVADPLGRTARKWRFSTN